MKAEARVIFYSHFYKALGPPRIKLSKTRPDLEGLYDGSMIASTTAWWNLLVEKRPELVNLSHFVRYEKETTLRLAESVNPRNRETLHSLARKYADPRDTEFEAAAIALAYALARTFAAGREFSEGRDKLLARGRLLTSEGFQGYLDDNEQWAWMEWSPDWWLRFRLEHWTLAIAVRAIRWAYDDQIKRWEKSEGRTVRSKLSIFDLGAEFFDAECIRWL